MSKKKDLQTRKSELIERLGVYKENEEQLAPLAARILATLILNDRKGVTFDDLVTDLKASKSTVCTHLNTLQAGGRVSYFTKPGDRKRYFIVSPNHLIQIMDETMDKWNTQKQIHQDILDYKALANAEILTEEEANFDLEFHQDYLKFLEEASESIKNLKQKLINKHIQDE